jgi:ankyrin repeat protein
MSIPFSSFLFGQKKTQVVDPELLETNTYRKSANAGIVEVSSLMMRTSKSEAHCDDGRMKKPRLVPIPRHLWQTPVPLSLPATDITLRYIRERNWEAALHRLAICPADARYSEVPITSSSSSSSSSSQQQRQRRSAVFVAEPNDSLLHTACLYRAPNELLERLLLLCNPDTVWTRNSQGWIPLHIHITYSTTPCTALIQAGGAKAIRMKWHGGTALHLACRHTGTAAMTPLLQSLVDLAPDCVTIPTHANVYPVELIFRQQYPSSLGGSVGQWESWWILVAAWKDYTTNQKKKNCTSSTSATTSSSEQDEPGSEQQQQQQLLCDLIAFAADCWNPHSNVCVVSLYLDQAQPVAISKRVQRLAAQISTPRVIMRLHQQDQCRRRDDDDHRHRNHSGHVVVVGDDDDDHHQPALHSGWNEPIYSH